MLTTEESQNDSFTTLNSLQQLIRKQTQILENFERRVSLILSD